MYKEIQSGAVAKSYIRKGFLIYEEMRKYFPISEEAVSHIWLCNCSIMNFLWGKLDFLFYQCRFAAGLGLGHEGRYLAGWWCVGRNRKRSRTHFYSFSAGLSEVFIFILEGATFSRTFKSIDMSIRVDLIRSPARQEGLLHPLSSVSRVSGHVRQQMVAQSCSPLPLIPSCWPTIQGETCIVIFLSLWKKV